MCVAFMLASAVVQATTQCSSGAECPSNSQPQSGVLLLQTKLQINPNEGGAKPECILHVGPHKAGSTSLQMMLLKNAAMLQRDGWHQPPALPAPARLQAAHSANLQNEKNVANIGIFLNMGTQDTLEPVWQTFVSWLEERARNSENIVLSSEEFDKDTMNIPLLVKALRKFHTTVVINYRSFFEWVPSVYREIASRTPIDTLSRWLTPHMATTIGKDEKPWTQGVLFTDGLVRAYAPHFDIRVLELEGAFLNTFVCSFLSASRTCASLSNKPDKMMNVRAQVTGDACASQGGCLHQDVRTVLLDRTLSTATEVASLSPSPPCMNKTELAQQLDELGLCFCEAIA